MGQLWVSASHLRDANQGLKLRDQPLGQRCSSASEWLFKHGDARIDFSSSLKERREAVVVVMGGVYSTSRGLCRLWLSASLDGSHPLVPGHPLLIRGA